MGGDRVKGDVYQPRRYIAVASFDGEASCRFCPLEETYSRKQCRRTGEYITDDNFTGRDCPLIEITEGEFLELLKKKEKEVNE